MNLTEMNGEQLEARKAELLSEMKEKRDALNTDELEARQAEILALDAELEARRAAAAEEARQAEEVAKQAGKKIFKEEKSMNYNAASPEYRTAWLKNLAVRDGVSLFGEMTTEERDAFTFLTSNTGAVVPTEVMNRIIELVESTYPMYADAAKSNMTSGFAIPRHKTIAAGDAAATNEAAANADEQDTFDQLPLDGVEIKKHLVISRKMKWQSIDAFQAWVEKHIAERIGVAKETRIRTQLDNATYGIDAGNVVANATCDDAGIRALLAKIKGQGVKVVYANANTIWTKLAGVNDGAGNKAFIPSPMVDPITQGRIYGIEVKLDDNLTDNVVYIGIPSMILANEFETLFMNHAMDPKTFEDIVAGYSLFDAGLENPKSFVKATFQ